MKVNFGWLWLSLSNFLYDLGIPTDRVQVEPSCVFTWCVYTITSEFNQDFGFSSNFTRQTILLIEVICWKCYHLYCVLFGVITSSTITELIKRNNLYWSFKQLDHYSQFELANRLLVYTIFRLLKEKKTRLIVIRYTDYESCAMLFHLRSKYRIIFNSIVINFIVIKWTSISFGSISFVNSYACFPRSNQSNWKTTTTTTTAWKAGANQPANNCFIDLWRLIFTADQFFPTATLKRKKTHTHTLWIDCGWYSATIVFR